ncbi:MAG: hypothetical protein ACRBBW_13175 [Cellvibrionaceae bacterium]
MIYKKTKEIPSGSVDFKFDAPRIVSAMRHTVVVTGSGAATVKAQVGGHPEKIELGEVSSGYESFSLDGVAALYFDVTGGDVTVTAAGN